MGIAFSLMRPAQQTRLTIAFSGGQTYVTGRAEGSYWKFQNKRFQGVCRPESRWFIAEWRGQFKVESPPSHGKHGVPFQFLRSRDRCKISRGL